MKTPQYLDFFAKYFTGKHSLCNEESETTTSRTFLRIYKDYFSIYQLPTLLNNLNAESEILKHVFANIENSTLLGLKRITKNYFFDKYSYFCHIPDCYIYQEITTDWENLFIKIKQKSNSAKNFIIGNIYRAPKELAQDLTIFNAEFAETLDFTSYEISHLFMW